MREQDQARPKMLDAAQAAPKEKGPAKVNDSRLTPKQRDPQPGARAASNMHGPKQKQQMEMVRQRQKPKEKPTSGGAAQQPEPARGRSRAEAKTGASRAPNAAASGPQPKQKPKMNAPKTAAGAAGIAGKEASQILKKGYRGEEEQRLSFAHEGETHTDYAMRRFENTGRRSLSGVKQYGGRTARGVKNTVEQQKKKLQIKRAQDTKAKKGLIKKDAQKQSAARPKSVTSGSKLKQGGGAGKRAKNRASSRAAQHARQRAAKQARKKAVKAAVKTTKKVAQMIARATAAVAKALAAILPYILPFILCIAIVAAIAALIASPFGIFFSDEETGADVTPIRDVVEQINAEFQQEIEDIKSGQSYDDYVIEYAGSADGTKINNWIDVLAVFAVKTATPQDAAGGMDVVTIDAERVDLIREVFFDMNTIEWELEEREYEDGDGSWTERVLIITVTSKTAWQQADDYGFTDEQREILAEMLSGDYDEYFYMLLGIASGGNLTPEDIQDILDALPDGVGRQIVELCLSRMGDPYSQELAGTGRYTDCSHLVQWAYAQVGAGIPRTAAEQARFVVDGGLEISRSDLQPGDLIFWSYDTNGRYMNVGHVAVYVADGYVVHASSVEMQVWYEPIFHDGNIVLYGRIA